MSRTPRVLVLPGVLGLLLVFGAGCTALQTPVPRTPEPGETAVADTTPTVEGAGPVGGATTATTVAAAATAVIDEAACGLPGPNQDAIVAYVQARCFRLLPRDPAIRSSGPLIYRSGSLKDLSTHNRVRVYYTQGVLDWLEAGRPAGELADGEMMIKEMFPSDTREKDANVPLGYATMVRDSAGSVDGWFWSSYITQKGDPRLPVGKAGWSDCLICHSSADNPENTFADLSHVDGSLVEPQEIYTETTAVPGITATPTAVRLALPTPLAAPNAAFVALFDQPLQPADPQALAFPMQLPYDHAPAAPPIPDRFLTSDTCSGCHSARISNITGRNMVAQDATGQMRNMSPFGEWSASVMGLAGRDPVFHAQLASEKQLRPAQTEYLDNTCYRCHGVMGLRQLKTDKDEPFRHEMIYATGDDPYAKYGALARDGVSCTVCHGMSAEGLGTEATYTGQFNVGPANEVYGPYQDVKPYAMQTGLGITPKHGEQLGTSAMCGSCHSVILPRVPLGSGPDAAKDPKVQQGHEQATYLEWRNSAYQNESEPMVAADVKTCQECHMPREYDGQVLSSRIANIEDNRYPEVPNRAADELITLDQRVGYRRHTLVGANQFTLRMFGQFTELLGISTYNPYGYNGTVVALLTAADEGLKMAQNETATVALNSVERQGDKLVAQVSVTNHAGHKFPSGVNFRRAFLELAVSDAAGKELWVSGATNDLGQIVDGSGEVLGTEMSRKEWQPHYATITEQDQVQIYEERNTNEEGLLTTSFLDLFHDVKDNRLLPKGWRNDAPDTDFMQPVAVDGDPRYADGSGADEITYEVPLSAVPGAASVRATLYYQAIPPYYLQDRFTTGADKETQRLYYVASHLATDGSPIEDWKLKIGAAEAPVR